MYNGKVVVPDISFYQDDDLTPQKVDFAKMRSNGADGVILRAGQNTWKDEDLDDYVVGCRNSNMPFGLYFFFDSRSSPQSQAEFFSSIINSIGFPSLGIWGDFEENYGGAYAGLSNFRIFMDSLRSKYPNKIVGIYTRASYWEQKAVTESERNWGKTFPLWVANYYVDTPRIPKNWSSYTFWQFTDKGDGISFGVESKQIDLNYFGGTFDEYKNFFGLDIQDPEPPTGGKMLYGKISAGALNLRDNYGWTSSGSPVGSIILVMVKDQLVTASEKISGWWHIIELAGNPVNGWAYEGSSGTYITEVVPPQPPPPPPSTTKPTLEILYNSNEVEVILKPQ